jgi:hypothetical protein
MPYFASDGNGSWNWDKLPSKLEDQLKEQLNSAQNGFDDEPRIVALGMGGDYVLITAQDKVFYQLENFPSVKELLETFKTQGKTENLRNVVLSTDAKEALAVEYEGGIAVQGLPADSEPNIKAFQEAYSNDAIKHHQKTQGRNGGQGTAAQRSANAASTARTNALLAMATRQADMQTMRNAQQSSYAGWIGYVCSRCKRNPAECVCSGGYDHDVMGDI